MDIRSEHSLADPRVAPAETRPPAWHAPQRRSQWGRRPQDGDAASPVAGLLPRAGADPLVLDEPEVAGFFALEIARRVWAIMMQNVDQGVVERTLRQIGVGSLMAVELRGWRKLGFGIEMTTLEIMGGGTILDLAGLTVKKIKERMAGA
ncbi:hypothetical protein OQA88_9212 [Cercophora sp. LCS_1]